MANFMRNNGNIVSKVEHTFHGICLVMHTLRHMRQNFLHRLLQVHHTMRESGGFCGSIQTCMTFAF